MKKYDFIECILFFIIVFLLSFPVAFANLPLKGKVFYVDPGHGGVDPGSVVDNILEKDINLNISKFLKEELQKFGATVYMTRDGDYDLGSPNATFRKKSDFDGRIKKINQSKADFYLSIHLNVLKNSSYSGPQIFYNKKKEQSAQLASYLQTKMNEAFSGNREIEPIPSTTYMYSKLNIPGVLIECGFLSNYEESKLLITEDYQKKIASTIAEAIRNFSF